MKININNFDPEEFEEEGALPKIEKLRKKNEHPELDKEKKKKKKRIRNPEEL